MVHASTATATRGSGGASLQACRASEKGSAMLEAALTLPLILLVSVAIFEFGRAYQTWQIVTNAAREGARISVLPNPEPGAVESRVREYMKNGQLPKHADAEVVVNRASTLQVGSRTVSASEVIVDYPFEFVALQPVARLISAQATAGEPITIRASAVMRNEAQ